MKKKIKNLYQYHLAPITILFNKPLPKGIEISVIYNGAILSNEKIKKQ